MRQATRLDRCSRSGRRRSRIRCSARRTAHEAGAALPARSRLLPGLHAASRSPRRCRPSSCSASTSTSRRSPTRCSAHARDIVERLIARARRSAPTASPSRSRATTATCCRTTRRRASRCSASSRPRNIAQVAPRSAASRRSCEFFGDDLARAAARRGRARRRHPRQQRARPRARPERLRRGHRDAAQADDGVAVIEVPYVKDLIEQLRVRHDLSRAPVLLLADGARSRCSAAHGLAIVGRRAHADPRRLAALSVARSESAARRRAVGRALLADEERRWGVDAAPFYRGFAARVEELRDAAARRCSTTSRRAGKRIAAYGAAAKGSTLLNYFGIGRETLDFVVDRSTHKQGQVHARRTHPDRGRPNELAEAGPDYMLLLTWNFADEILRAAGRSIGAPAAGSSCRSRTSAWCGARHACSSATEIAGAFLIRPERSEDDRGFFARTCASARSSPRTAWPRASSSAASRSTSERGTLRGIHFQAAPHAENKLVSCSARRDLTTSSSTCGRHRRATGGGSASSSPPTTSDALYIPGRLRPRLHHARRRRDSPLRDLRVPHAGMRSAASGSTIPPSASSGRSHPS